MTVQSPQRGAIPSPRHVLAAATPHVPLVGAPPNFITVPQKISWWGNSKDGDCVTAEEAFAKTCNNPEIFISDDEAIAWATRHNALHGAVIADVLKWMQDDGFPNGSGTYDDGPYFSVNWTDSTILKSAISQGPVKIGVAANQIQAPWQQHGGKTGWFGIGWRPDNNVDHCVSLCGYGTLAWLAQQLNVPISEGIDINQSGYAMFTWNSIGIVDEASMLAVTHEAWLRQPTTVTKSSSAYQLAVINTQGEVWARDVTESTVSAGHKLSGSGLFGVPGDICVVGLSDSIAVVTKTGDVWNHGVTQSTVGDSFNVGNILGASVSDNKYVLSDGCSCIFVVTTAGELWGHDLSHNKIGGGYKFNGSSLFGGSGDKYVVYDNHSRERVLVVTTEGEVWAHDLSSSKGGSAPLDTIGGGYKLDGSGLFGGPDDIGVVYLNGQLLVINTQGEVWARNITGSTVSAGVKLSGSGLFGAPDYKYVIAYHCSVVA